MPRWCLGVEVLWPGDARGNGLLRRVSYRLPLGRRGTALELVSEVEPARGYTYRMISREPGNDQTGRVRLEPLGPGRTRLHFEERYHLVSAPWRWFEGPIYRFINKQNEASMRRLSEWLTAHPSIARTCLDKASRLPGLDAQLGKDRRAAIEGLVRPATRIGGEPGGPDAEHAQPHLVQQRPGPGGKGSPA